METLKSTNNPYHYFDRNNLLFTDPKTGKKYPYEFQVQQDRREDTISYSLKFVYLILGGGINILHIFEGLLDLHTRTEVLNLLFNVGEDIDDVIFSPISIIPMVNVKYLSDYMTAIDNALYERYGDAQPQTALTSEAPDATSDIKLSAETHDITSDVKLKFNKSNIKLQIYGKE